MKHFQIVFYLLFPLFLVAQPGLYKAQKDLIGTRIEKLEINQYLQNEPVDKNYNTKFKVLEFWATWCKPCLAAVPHLNKLQQKFKDRDLVFFSITAESKDKTAPTLRKVKFETIVVSDSTRSIHRMLKIENEGSMGLPRTVLIDNENRIVWYGSPKKLTPELIEKFLRKQPLED